MQDALYWIMTLVKNDKPPTCRLARELAIQRAGFDFVIGADEVGRGPLAGPVVAGAVAILDPFAADSDFCELLVGVDDSKRLSPLRRTQLYAKLTRHPVVAWGVAAVTPAVIDRINILQASRLAMKRAIQNLARRHGLDMGLQNTFCFIDGNTPLKIGYHQETVIGGDREIFSISAASIIAKVTRDRTMARLEKIYPGYGFYRHKGYGTKIHLEALARLGPCRIHRKSFAPVLACGGNCR